VSDVASLDLSGGLPLGTALADASPGQRVQVTVQVTVSFSFD